MLCRSKRYARGYRGGSNADGSRLRSLRCLATTRAHSNTSALCRNLHNHHYEMKPIIAVPAIAVLVYRAYSKKSLTPVGILTAFATAIIHVIHPWSVFFALLATFFVAGSTVTKVSLVHDSLGYG
jgi:hypothetical protein